MFKKILIANRGEIACRIIKSARKMGVRTVAVYSEADALALHARQADERVLIGPPPVNQSYLAIERIVQACRDTGAEAVHPGYGFLSENGAFRKALDEAGIVFIGPDAPAIETMGDKIASKRLAAETGVSTIPGVIGVVKDADEAAKAASEIGYPVMIKASAGGGGKGMRIAWSDDELRDGFERAASEARSSFGDDRMLIEKFIEQPRHIEIQVLSDGETCLYLNERECSIQRRNQKVVEEAPSPFLDDATRKAMGEQAVRLAQAVRYRSAGTVEFVVDPQRNFYFLEMNTRLQVEHPVTEMTTGVDLVEWMIRIANGEKLALRQSDVGINGWAIETRIYAEDSYRNFVPSTGRLTRYLPPEETGTVRVDAGVFEGGEISMFYDPMIAKLITWGETREAATRHMLDALDRYCVRGVSHNIPFLSSVLTRERFVSGALSTDFIAEEYPDGFKPWDDPPQDLAARLTAAAGVIHRLTLEREAAISGQMRGYQRKIAPSLVIRFERDPYIDVTVVEDPPGEGGFSRGWLVCVDGAEHVVRSDWTLGDLLWIGEIDGDNVAAQVDRIGAHGCRLSARGVVVEAKAFEPHAAELDKLMPVKSRSDLSRFLLSPMPGLLLSVGVEAGGEVKAGEALAVIEAMKMENVLRAERDGLVKAVHAKAGDSVAVDQTIVEFE